MGVTAADLTQIPMSPELGATLSRGAEFAAQAGAANVTLEHLLAALCDDSDAIAVLDASNVNGAALKSDIVSQFVQAAADPADAPTSLGVSPDVRRILEAAAAAARGSRRRDINGAIVLAAIVGDGRSAAADILQAHGLTFDSAIRALQAALASAPARQAPPVAQPPVADDVLARARERVQSRSAPSLRELMKDMPQPVPPPSHGPGAGEPSLPDGGATAYEEPYPASPGSDVPEPPLPPKAKPMPSSDSTPAFEDLPDPASGSRPHEPDAGEVGRPGFGGGQPAAPDVQPQEPRPGPSLGVPDRPMAQPSVRGTMPGEPYAPAQPSNQQAPYPVPPAAGPGFPEYLPRPLPMGGPPPPIPVPPAPVAPGSRPRGGGSFAPSPASMPPASMPSPSMAPPGPLTSEPGLRADIRLDQAPAGAPTAGLPRQLPAKEGTGRKRSKAQKTETGQLAENIPRAMRVGKTERVEIRIAKASLKALTEGLEGGGAVWQHQITVTKAMAVRMRAPDGGFFIESASPETQWIENNLGFGSDDFASWRFLITPQSRGWAQLQIIVSARTVGADGVAAETALPDQVIEVKVRRNLKRTFARLFGWTVAAIAGGALATFGESGLMAAKAFLDSLIR